MSRQNSSRRRQEAGHSSAPVAHSCPGKMDFRTRGRGSIVLSPQARTRFRFQKMCPPPSGRWWKKSRARPDARRKTGAHVSSVPRPASLPGAGRRRRVPPLIKKPAAVPQPGGSFRQDAAKDTVEARAPILLRAASAFPESDADAWQTRGFLHSLFRRRLRSGGAQFHSSARSGSCRAFFLMEELISMAACTHCRATVRLPQRAS